MNTINLRNTLEQYRDDILNSGFYRMLTFSIR